MGGCCCCCCWGGGAGGAMFWAGAGGGAPAEKEHKARWRLGLEFQGACPGDTHIQAPSLKGQGTVEVRDRLGSVRCCCSGCGCDAQERTGLACSSQGQATWVGDSRWGMGGDTLSCLPTCLSVCLPSCLPVGLLACVPQTATISTPDTLPGVQQHGPCSVQAPSRERPRSMMDSGSSLLMCSTPPHLCIAAAGWVVSVQSRGRQPPQTKPSRQLTPVSLIRVQEVSGGQQPCVRTCIAAAAGWVVGVWVWVLEPRLWLLLGPARKERVWPALLGLAHSLLRCQQALSRGTVTLRYDQGL